MQIVGIETPEQIEAAGQLFREYAAGLPCSLDFQGFDQEIAQLPGEYAPPTGKLLLLQSDVKAAGCVGLRRLTPQIAEMKRLYVRNDYRHGGWGRKLALAILGEARLLGYTRMQLDTLPSMVVAIELYRSLGFQPIPAYCHNPIQGALFMELTL